MKAKRIDRDVLHAEFTKQLGLLCDQMLLFRDNLCRGVLVDTEVKYDHDYKQFGKDAFIYKLKTILETMQADESIMKQVEDLINDKYQ